MDFLQLETALPAIGYLGIFFIVFAESGLLIGFFLPGDSLLFTAGFLASQNIFNIGILSSLCFVAAVAGDSVGYAFGNRVGKRVFQREDSLLFHKDNLERTRAFYERHGKKTIILARFVPVIRTFAPIVAGVGDMEYRTFLAFNVAGGLLWAVGITVMGYYLGKSIPDVDRYLLPILAVIILASVAPGIIHVLKEESQRKRLFLLLKKPFKRKKAP